MPNTIPIVDLFAGPGGLGEGFSAFTEESTHHPFRIALSIECDEWAHKTLTLRAFYRWFIHNGKTVPPEFYRYLSTPLHLRNRETLFKAYPIAADAAQKEALNITLGQVDPKKVDDMIAASLRDHDKWVLIGGPPCQAYSLAGRSRILGRKTSELMGKEISTGLTTEDLVKKRKDAWEQAEQEFSSDKRHTLYREYLRIIAKHAPSVFVMENVRGILTSKTNGTRIFPTILRDLRHPYGIAHEYWPRKQFKDREYRIYSFVTGEVPADGSETDYLIKAEQFGVPQARHRVILLGVRHDIATASLEEAYPKLGDHCGTYKQLRVRDVIGELPHLRSGVSKGKDSLESWRGILAETQDAEWLKDLDEDILAAIEQAVAKCRLVKLPRSDKKAGLYLHKELLRKWYNDPNLTCLLNHDTRGHMPSDLCRYLFVSAFGSAKGRSPKLHDFPVALLPDHRNIDIDDVKMTHFSDRFRVQCWNGPATTITCHISKDGHYFIHPDPSQCRSLTVREAARIQTFPDNYLFEGPRTEQYRQVGNAVPPLLACSLAKIVRRILG